MIKHPVCVGLRGCGVKSRAVRRVLPDGRLGRRRGVGVWDSRDYLGVNAARGGVLFAARAFGVNGTPRAGGGAGGDVMAAARAGGGANTQQGLAAFGRSGPRGGVVGAVGEAAVEKRNY